VGLISLEGFNEKDRLQERGGYLDDPSAVLGFGDMEEFLVRVEIVREPLYHPPVPEPDDDFVFYFQQDAPPYLLGLNPYSKGFSSKDQPFNDWSFLVFWRRLAL